MGNINKQLDALREKFREDISPRLEAMVVAFAGVKSGDGSAQTTAGLEELSSLAHKMTGSAGTFGFHKISEISGQIEDLCIAVGKGDRPLCAEDYATIGDLLERLKAEAGLNSKVSISENFDWLALESSRDNTEDAGVKKILFVDDDVAQSSALIAQLSHFQFDVTWLDDVEKLAAALKQDSYDALIMDIIFPGGNDAGVKAIQKLRDKKHLKCPVIFLSLRGDIEARLGAVRAGCDGYLVKPVDIVDIIDVLKNVTKVSAQDHYRVTVIDDDPGVAKRNALLLEAAGAKVKMITDPLHAMDSIAETIPDVILMDVNMPGCNGFELAGVIRQQPDLLQVPIVFLTAIGGKKRQKMALRSGGDDFLQKTDPPEMVVDAVMMRAKKSRDLNRIIRRLRSSERRFRALSESANEAIITINEYGQLVFWNAGAEKTFGHTGINILGQSIFTIIPERHHAALKEEFSKALTRGLSDEARAFEGVGLTETGDEIPVECSLSKWEGEGRKFFTATVRDISERKSANELIRTSEQRVRLLLSAAGEGIYGFGMDGRTTFVNPAVCKMLGYSEEELVGQSMHALAHHTYPDGTPFPHTECPIYRAIREGVINHSTDEVFWRKDATSFPVEYTSTPIVQEGEILGAVVVIHDITERLAIEEKVKSLARFPEENPFPVLRVDGDGNVIYANASAQIFATVENRKAVNCDPGGWNKLMVHARTRNRADNVEVACDGKIYSFLVSPSDTADDVNLYGGDITQRKLAENNLKMAMRDADEANRAKSQFLSSMSHELRTPLNAILGFAQILETDRDAPLNEDQIESVKQILSSGKHLLDLIGDVLDLSKVESGSVDVSVEDVDIVPLIEESVFLIESQARKRSITVTNKAQEKGSLFLKGDYVRLKQVFLNFLSNAVKYNSENGDVTITAEPRKNGNIRISIQDTGEGVEESDLKNLFEPFNRLGHENSAIEGTGIGLTITKRLVEMMGGKIGVDSVVHKGTTFWVEFEKSEGVLEKAGEVIEAIELIPAVSSEQSERTYKVLYVEDNPSNMNLIRNLMRKLPQYQFFEAITAEDGLELAFSQSPDIILMDINLPGASGFDALEVLQDQGMTDLIKVIALSANATQDDMEKGRQAGFFDYLTKPVDITELINVLEKAANHS